MNQPGGRIKAPMTRRGRVSVRALRKSMRASSQASVGPGMRLSHDPRGGLRIVGSGGVGRWTGVVYVAGRPFRDTDMVPDEISGSDGTITDNSTAGAKTWIKVDVSPAAEVVSYEDAPVFVSGRFPEDTEYYERAKTAGDIHVTRFG